MPETKPLIERAFELARSGKFAGLTDLRVALRAEGYTRDSDLDGLALRRQLKRICSAARNP